MCHEPISSVQEQCSKCCSGCGRPLSYHEPIFSDQEQAVVYLFSRYWDKIDAFRGKRLYDIHTHFPDFLLQDIETGAVEALEFEYGLSDFNHFGKPLQELEEEEEEDEEDEDEEAQDEEDEPVKLLYIVYWEEDDDRDAVERKIRKDFSGKVVFVCLGNYFSPCLVKPVSGCLKASWVFCTQKQFGEVYPFSEIEEATNELMQHGAKRLKCHKDLYASIGFNKEMANYIECDHWRMIHFFTTTTHFNLDTIPSKLLIKPTGYESYSGYFDVKCAFVIQGGTREVKEFFKSYYFYPYSRDRDCRPGKKKYSTCFVYRQFVPFTDKQGIALFKYLKAKKYAIGKPGAKIIENTNHIEQIDQIISQSGD